MKPNILFSIIFVLALSNGLFAQSVEFTKYNFPNNKDQLSDALSYIKKGDKLSAQGPGMYKIAITEYLKAHKFNPNNALLNYKIGKCYLYDNDKSEAITYLEKARKLDPRISLDMTYNDVNWLLATAYHQDYQFDKAIEKYTDHRNALNPEQLANETVLVDKRIEECNFAKKMVDKPARVYVDNMGKTVNSAYPDYRPLVDPHEDMIVFTSSRENTTGQKRADDSFYFEDIYVTYYDEGKWTLPDNNYDINSTNHDATAGISSDGSIMYVYKSGGGGTLYESRLLDNMYSYPLKLDNKINEGIKQTSASLTFDKSTLYFTSLREDGYGGLDIYVSRKDARDRWQEPINIGATINTPYDEQGVFITPDGKTLYFSSKGHNSMGGYDIFKAEFANGQWSNPVNLGYPINTPDNDVSFTMGASGLRAYYSSKKKDGFGDQDLYMITFLGASKPMKMYHEDVLLACNTSAAAPVMELPIEQNTILEGVILDAESLSPLQATIEITDNSKNEILASFESNASTGAYLISLKPGKNYGITVSRKNYLFHSENFNIKMDAVAKRIKKDVLLKEVEVGIKIVLNNIFFDFNKATLRDESIAELNRLTKLMNDTPSLKIEISGHTDNIGSASYNKKLSESRAKAVVNYLTKIGIDSDRLTFAGYGFDQPIADNKTEEGRQQNRRTEFKVLKK
jgi:outer membrane protein OmpA-like peptidoglycan-associated protein/tetratricopeptide (TPR) repeat protein